MATKTTVKRLKKVLLLLSGASIALLIDGSLTYDIFDTREETIKGWLLFLLFIAMIAITWVIDHTKPGS